MSKSCLKITEYRLISFMMTPKHFLSIADRYFHFALGSSTIVQRKYLELFGMTTQVTTNFWEKTNQTFDTYAEPKYLLRTLFSLNVTVLRILMRVSDDAMKNPFKSEVGVLQQLFQS